MGKQNKALADNSQMGIVHTAVALVMAWYAKGGSAVKPAACLAPPLLCLVWSRWLGAGRQVPHGGLFNFCPLVRVQSRLAENYLVCLVFTPDGKPYPRACPPHARR
ncbi:hypothetical protein GCM10023185_38790 [Hymenobacter saemangeumensis]|uniref:Uncharacterized protein n=1 Tax=Hymenobacter saemangeumensis TaxID=1084522 RepID=A0ABP8IQN1_9BACT